MIGSAQAAVRNVVVQERDFVTEGCGRPDGSVSLVMLFNILHTEDPMTLLHEAHRVLVPGGIAGVIHWRRDIQTPRGPPLEIRPDPAQCEAWGERARPALSGDAPPAAFSVALGDGVAAAHTRQRLSAVSPRRHATQDTLVTGAR